MFMNKSLKRQQFESDASNVASAFASVSDDVFSSIVFNLHRDRTIKRHTKIS
jgi:hypothetical protein